MDPTTASTAVREPGGRYGDLPPLARQALQPRVSRIETELKLSELQAARSRTAETGDADVPHEAARALELTAPPAPSPGVQERRGDPPPLRENPAYRLASFREAVPAPSAVRADEPSAPRAEAATDEAISEAAAPAGNPPPPPVPGTPVSAARLTDPDGYRRSLLSVQNELRGLRADIAALARVLGQPASPALVPTAPGVLQLHDPLNPAVKSTRFERQEQLLNVSPQQIAAETEQRFTARRLTLKQDQLLRALQRAERRLQDAPPGTIPPGLRDQVIGEILRARYNVALFGGLGGAILTGRLANAVA
jgi:hypothetical protein